MQIYPTTIQRISSQQVKLAWNDGVEALIDSRRLRDACPCASCREQRGDTSHAEPLTPRKSLLNVVKHSSDEATALTEIWAIGRYAVGCRWGDGHDTGIYPYQLLRELSTH